MKQIRRHLTYANVMSSIAVFLILGGATAFAAKHVLPKKSVGVKQLKANAVTTAKIKKNAVTTPKIKDGSVNGAKIADGSITGAEINASTLGTVPNSATTNVIRTSKGTIAAGQEATALEYGPFKVVVKCEFPTANPSVLSAHAFISSSTDGSLFASWEDVSKNFGPGTPEDQREINSYSWISSGGPFDAEPPVESSVSAQAANGQSFNAYLGLAAEKDSSTCWYWMDATILG